MNSDSKQWGKLPKYGLKDIPVGETKAFPNLTTEELSKYRRSAHNYNVRGNMYFSTRYKNGTLYVTRIS